MQAGIGGTDLLQNKKKVLLRCDFGPEVGFGHIMRSTALAERLLASGKWDVRFATIAKKKTIYDQRELGFPCFFSETENLSSDEEQAWIEKVRREFPYDVLVLDIRTDLSDVGLTYLKSEGVYIVLIDDASTRRFSADMCFFPPVPQVRSVDWSNYSGEIFCGPEWTILRSQFQRLRAKGFPKKNGQKAKNILITMGAVDPQNYSTLALRVLERVEQEIKVKIVIGANFHHLRDLRKQISSCKLDIELDFDVRDMAETMAMADLAVASFGVTAYELACVGVPSILFSISEDHAKSASYLAENGVAINLAPNIVNFEEEVFLAMTKLLKDEEKLLAMSSAGINLFDGYGAVRIAQKLEQIKLK